MTSRDQNPLSENVAPCVRKPLTFDDFSQKSLARKLAEKLLFRKIHLCDHCDLQGHHRSQVMVRNDRLHMSFYLSIIVTIGLLVIVSEI